MLRICLIIFFLSALSTAFSQKTPDYKGLPYPLKVINRYSVVLTNQKSIPIDSVNALLAKIDHHDMDLHLAKYNYSPKSKYVLNFLGGAFIFASLGQIGLKDGRGLFYIGGAAASFGIPLINSKKKHLKNAIYVYNREVYKYNLLHEK